MIFIQIQTVLGKYKEKGRNSLFVKEKLEKLLPVFQYVKQIYQEYS